MRWLPIALCMVVLLGAGCVPVPSPPQSEPSEETAVQVTKSEPAVHVVRYSSRVEPFPPPLIGTLQTRACTVQVYADEELRYTVRDAAGTQLATRATRAELLAALPALHEDLQRMLAEGPLWAGSRSCDESPRMGGVWFSGGPR